MGEINKPGSDAAGGDASNSANNDVTGTTSNAVTGTTSSTEHGNAATGNTGHGNAATGNTADVDVAAVSFKDFYATHRDKLSRALGLYFGNADLGAEAADEAFARAFERWQTIAHHPNPYGWVYVVGTNRARSMLKRRAVARNKQRLLNPASGEDFAIDAADEAGDFDTKDAVSRLRPTLRSVVIARFYLEMSVEQTAEVLHIKQGTVKSRLSRALAQLRTELGGGLDDGLDNGGKS